MGKTAFALNIASVCRPRGGRPGRDLLPEMAANSSPRACSPRRPAWIPSASERDSSGDRLAEADHRRRPPFGRPDLHRRHAGDHRDGDEGQIPAAQGDAGLGLVVLDYLQLMRGSSFKDSREQEISEISRSLKALAKELAAGNRAFAVEPEGGGLTNRRRRWRISASRGRSSRTRT